MKPHANTAPVGSIQKFSVEDGPGIRTTIFLKGCPLACSWCHNPEMIDFSPQLIALQNRCIGCGHCIEACSRGALSLRDGKIQVDWGACDACLACVEACYAGCLQSVAQERTVDDLVEEAEKDKGFYDHTGGGITVSGGEMLSRPHFVEALAARAAECGIGVCLDTSGYGDCDALMALARKENVTDILYDIKNMCPEAHREGTGVDNERILNNLERLASDDAVRRKITIRMPMIKGYNDSDDAMEQVAQFLCRNGLERITLLPYHTLGVPKQERLGQEPERFEPPAESRLAELRKQLERHGLAVEILGQ